MPRKKLILYIATSIDGYIARLNGSVDWLDTYNNTGEDYGYKVFFKSVNTVIVGNTTQKQFPTNYGGKTCYVFSKKKHDPVKNITYVNGDVKKFINEYKPQGVIWLVGGSDLLNQFLKYDLIDEFIISIIPELLGDGIPLFKEKSYVKKLTLIKSQSYRSGIVLIHYKR